MTSNTAGAKDVSGKGGIPGMRGVEHIALTVPDLEAATAFFVDELGCEVYYSIGPFKDQEGNWFAENLDVHPRAEIPEIRIVRCANGAHFELLTFTSPDQNTQMPRFSDYGGHHVAFYVDDMDLAIAYLQSKGIKVLGPVKDGVGPESGEGSTFVHFKSPWGSMFELVSFPKGRAYEQQREPLWVPDPVSQEAKE